MAEPERRGPPLVVIALEIEGQGLFERADISVLYTGLGKVNAALVLARKLATLRAQPQFANAQCGRVPKVRAARYGRDGPRLCFGRDAVRDDARNARVSARVR